jgi:hypothetical protein
MSIYTSNRRTRIQTFCQGDLWCAGCSPSSQVHSRCPPFIVAFSLAWFLLGWTHPLRVIDFSQSLHYHEVWKLLEIGYSMVEVVMELESLFEGKGCRKM